MSGASPGSKPDWTSLIIPFVVGVGFVAFYSSLLNAPPIDRVFITPLMIVGVFILAAVVWGEVAAIRSPAAVANGEAAPPIAKPWRVVGFIALMVLYLVGLEYVGFFVSSFAMLVIGMLWLGERNWLRIGTVSVCLIGIEFLLFAEVLEIPFPPSAIGLF